MKTTIKNIFHLNLKKKWFDMILKGEKKEEYRGLHWSKKIAGGNPLENSGKIKIQGEWIPAKDVTIIFSNGYAKDRPQFAISCKGLGLGYGKQEWGAEQGIVYYVLHLGEIIHKVNC